MRTSFQHQPEAQQPKSSAIHKLPADYPIYRRKTGQHILNASFSHFDPNVWSGRAVQEASSTWLMRSCINVSGLCLERVVLRAIMDISAHAISLAVRPRPGRSGHQCSHAPGRPIFHRRLVLSQTSAGKRRPSYIISNSSFALFLCSFLAAVTSSRPGVQTGPSTASGSRGSGRHCIGLDAREGAPLVKNSPGDAGELVGERDRQHVVV